jgi:hypothetical protein
VSRTSNRATALRGLVDVDRAPLVADARHDEEGLALLQRLEELRADEVGLPQLRIAAPLAAEPVQPGHAIAAKQLK